MNKEIRNSIFNLSEGTGLVIQNWTPQDLVDANRVGWYKPSILTTITKDGANLVSRFNDNWGLGNDLFRIGDDVYKPLWINNVLSFDGLYNFLKSGTFEYKQPATIYLVLKIKTWVLNDQIISGDVAFNPFLHMGPTVDKVRIGADEAYSNEINLPVNKWCLVKIVYNTTTSKIRKNRNIESVGNIGVYDLDGITLGCSATGGLFSNIELAEAIYRKGDEDIVTDNLITNYLIREHGITESAFDNGKLVITTDDSVESQYSIIYPTLVAKGVKGTFYTIASWIGTEGYCTWAQLQEMYAAGMDIQCHTNAHSNLKTLNQVQLVASLQAVNDAFTANSLPVPNHIAYPVGAYNQDTITWMAGMRVTGRAGSIDGDYVIWKDSEKFSLVSLAVNDIDDAGVVALKAKLVNVQNKKAACSLCLHGASAGGGLMLTPTAHIEEIIDYAKSIGMDIITTSELYALLD